MASTRNQKHIRITTTFVEKVQSPTSGQLIYRDSELKGFALRVTAGGAKTFVIEKRISGKVRRVKVARYPELNAQQARSKALDLLCSIAKGGDPVREKAEYLVSQTSLSQAYEDFISVRQLKNSTKKDYEWAMKFAFGDWQKLAFTKITQAMVIERHQELKQKGQTSADRHMRFLSSLINFAMNRFPRKDNQFQIPENPVRVLTRLKSWSRPVRRQSYIGNAALPVWFETVNALPSKEGTIYSEVVRDYLIFLLLTGLRREEAAQLTWSCVNLGDRLITIPNTKNGNEHVLPLSNYLLDLLILRKQKTVGEHVFPGRGPKGHIVNVHKQIVKIREVSGVYFTLHDLRRTFTTAADSLELSSNVVKRLLNHSSNYDVTAGYIVSGVNRLRRPMQIITDYLLSEAGIVICPSNVVAFAPDISSRPELSTDNDRHAIT